MSASEMMMLEEEFAELRAEVERLREFRNNALHAGGTDEVAEERAAVVAWLHEVLAEASLPLGVSQVFDAIVDAIERGEHRKEEE